jgi:hypothetical protein
LTARVTVVTGSAGPAGSVTFTAGSISLGSAAVIVSATTATATLSVKGASLAVGDNIITASYTPTGNFSTSTASVTVTVTVTGSPVGTKTAVAASPASIAATGTAQLVATVTPAGGSLAPTGSVAFWAGNAALGTATLTASGAAAAATLSIAGSKLASGVHNITANYAGNGGVTASASASITVTVAAPLIATTASVAANPASIAQSASTVLTVTMKPASGAIAPTGSVIFTSGNASLGTATLVTSGGNATASLTVKGTSLAAGSDVVTVSYSGDSKYSASTGSVSVTVTAAPVATTTVAAPNPPTIAQNATTQITAVVKPATGSALPAGVVNFAIGNTSLGSATLTSSTGMASAVLSVAGSKLTLGSNSITASYAGSGSFNASTASVVVIVTAAPAPTSATLVANPASVAPSASTQLTVTVKAAAGSIAPTGNKTFTVGRTQLGTATLAPWGATATATLTVKGSSLASGSNSIVATYSGNGSFSGSTSTVIVDVVSSVASNIVASATKTTSAQVGFPVKIQLQEQAGVATTVTGFTINGANFTPVIGNFFGTTQVAAHGTLTGTMVIQWSPLPATLTFGFTGMDASGRQWSQTVSLQTNLGQLAFPEAH